VHELNKSYGPVEVIKNISFEIEEGEIFGFLGPNGAGKTTTIEILSGLKKANSGYCLFGETDNLMKIRGTHPHIGVQLQFSEFYPDLTVGETIRLFFSLHNRDRLIMDEYVEWLNLQDLLHQRVKNLSGGQKQRLSLCISLARDPKLLILDEPTVGLDPQSRRNLWDIIMSLREKGKTILLTTHYLEEAQRLCDRVAIMDHGELKTIGTIHEILYSLDYRYKISFKFDRDIQLEPFLSGLYGVSLTDQINGEFIVKAKELHPVIKELLQFIENEQLELISLQTSESSLEDLFIALTGKELRD
jgi:ABC-2 type transport system ATP-binding protein